MSVVGGASVASVAKKFAVHHMALHRHMDRHVDRETKINLIAVLSSCKSWLSVRRQRECRYSTIW